MVIEDKEREYLQKSSYPLRVWSGGGTKKEIWVVRTRRPGEETAEPGPETQQRGRG